MILVFSLYSILLDNKNIRSHSRFSTIVLKCKGMLMAWILYGLRMRTFFYFISLHSIFFWMGGAGIGQQKYFLLILIQPTYHLLSLASDCYRKRRKSVTILYHYKQKQKFTVYRNTNVYAVFGLPRIFWREIEIIEVSWSKLIETFKFLRISHK